MIAHRNNPTLGIIVPFFLLFSLASNNSNYSHARDLSESNSSSFSNIAYNCDNDAIHDNVKVSKLTPNTFYKVCPATQPGKAFGQPQCGDGTNFSFFFTRPIQKKANEEKILIEFLGGGACWDYTTCSVRAEMLTYPTKLDNFIGYSCSEISYGVSNGGSNMDGGNSVPISMLCAKTIGDVDFTSYNTIIIPYCTQDIHIGSNTAEYGDGTTVNHMGAHNMMSTLRWIFNNFPNPSHIALTGCSAGGTAVPIAYDIINKRYNNRIYKTGMRSVQISVLADSPVYLTPSYFLNNAFDEWNPWEIMSRLRFNFGKYRYNEEYPNILLDHILKRGPNADRWGVLSHEDDPVSLIYCKYMSGTYSNDNNNGDDNDMKSTWWNQLSSSLSGLQKNHRNVQTFFMESEGHCSVGLYYGLQYDGFESWASDIFREGTVLGRAPRSISLFFMSAILGFSLSFLSVVLTRRKTRDIIEDKVDSLLDVLHPNDRGEASQRTGVYKHCHCCWTCMSPFLERFHTCPITAGYAFSTSLYFLSMIIAEGFAHPLNNPALGPGAVTLSSFGINNPTLTVYDHQIWRLVTSIFLCSGVLTYMFVAYGLWKFIGPLEREMGNRVNLLLACFSIGIGCNLFYACVTSGASCSSIAMILGLNMFSMGLRVRSPSSEASFPRSIAYTTVVFLLTSLIFPFDSWIMLLAAMVIGGATSFLFRWDFNNADVDVNGICTPLQQKGLDLKPVMYGWIGILAVYFVMLLLILCCVPKPDVKYEYPFLTGCTLMYNTEIEDGMCAQVCVPNIARLVVLLGAERISGYTFLEGLCEDIGFEEHVADKTFVFMSYAVDVEIYHGN